MPMSEEQLKPFLEKANDEISLQEKIKGEGADLVALTKRKQILVSLLKI